MVRFPASVLGRLISLDFEAQDWATVRVLFLMLILNHVRHLASAGRRPQAYITPKKAPLWCVCIASKK